MADYFDELRRNGTVRTAIICIAGNHELTFETDRYDKVWHRFRLPGQVDKFDVRDARSRLERSCTYLEDSTTRIGTITFYGSPYQPEFGGWAFNVPRGDIDELWERIPSDVDVLITHGPPLGRGDVTSGNHRVGCVSLMKHVRDRLRPRLHVFGHVHEGYGVYHDGTTAYVNASSVRTSSTTNRPGKGGEDDGGAAPARRALAPGAPPAPCALCRAASACARLHVDLLCRACLLTACLARSRRLLTQQPLVDAFVLLGVSGGASPRLALAVASLLLHSGRRRRW